METLPSQLMKSISKVVRKVKFFTIFVPSFLRFKTSLSQSEFLDLLSSCNELLVSILIQLIQENSSWLLKKHYQILHNLYRHIKSSKNTHFYEIRSYAPYGASVVLFSRKTFRVIKLNQMQSLADILFTATIFVKIKTPAHVFSWVFCKIVRNKTFYITPPEDCFWTFNSIVRLCKMKNGFSICYNIELFPQR